MEGAITISRDWFEKDWSNNPNVGWLFVNLLLMAEESDTITERGIELKRGQILTARAKLSKQTGLSQQNVRTALKNLEAAGDIEINASNAYSVITICRYDVYNQGPTNKSTNLSTNLLTNPKYRINDTETDSYEVENCEANQPFNQQINQPFNQPKETNKEKRTKKENKKEIPSSSLLGASACEDLDGLFEELRGTAWYEGLQREIYRHSGRMPTDQDIGEYIARYKDQLILTGDADHERRDIQRHFTNWLRCAIAADNRKQNSNERGRDNRTDYEQRSDAEFETHIAAMLSGGSGVY